MMPEDSELENLHGEKFKALLYVEKVNGEHPEKAIGRKNFENP